MKLSRQILTLTLTALVAFSFRQSVYAKVDRDQDFSNLMFRLLPFTPGGSAPPQNPQTTPQPTAQPPGPTQLPNSQTQTADADIVDEQGRKVGVMTLTLRNGQYVLRTDFKAASPQSGFYYEIWLVRETPPDWVSLGKAQEASVPGPVRRYVNQTTTLPAPIIRDHKKLVITLEPDDGDPRPSGPPYIGGQIPELTTPTPPTQNPTTAPPTPTAQVQNPTQPPDQSENLRAVADSVSEQNIRDYLSDLVDDDDVPEADETQTRWSGSSGNNTERDYIKNHFEGFGMSVQLQPFSFQNTSTQNIIANIPGRKTDEVYLLTAHMDSTAMVSRITDPAPGADDNGSGTVAVMEAARALKESGLTFNYSLEFILFSGEEQGLVGSTHYVRNLPTGKRVKGVINLDMIANRGTSGDCVNFGYKPYNGGNLLSDAVVQNNGNFSIGLTTTSHQSSESRSDHKSFWDAGIPATFGHECDFSSVYHSTEDKTDKINFGQLTKTTRAVAATLAQFALAE